jgi:hypothetical protein
MCPDLDLRLCWPDDSRPGEKGKPKTLTRISRIHTNENHPGHQQTQKAQNEKEFFPPRTTRYKRTIF